MNRKRFSDVKGLRSYVSEVIGDGWPIGTEDAVAAVIQERAHRSGRRWGEDWTKLVDRILPECGWQDWVGEISARLPMEGE